MRAKRATRPKRATRRAEPYHVIAARRLRALRAVKRQVRALTQENARLRRLLKTEGIEHSECQEQVIALQAEIVRAEADAGTPDPLHALREAKYLNPECVAQGCQWLRATADRTPKED